MKISATHLRTCGVRLLATAAACSALGTTPAPALAQDEEQEVENVRDREPDAEAVAATPLSDLNLHKDEIPPLLLDARDWPYSTEGLVNCRAVEEEIARFDALLGPDYDIEAPESDRLSLGRIAQKAVGSFIPFRSIIREISGAAEHARDFREAIMAGAVRRGFLKGFGLQRGCPYPARPASVRIDLDEKDVERSGDRELPTGQSQTFVSEPVVQPVE